MLCDKRGINGLYIDACELMFYGGMPSTVSS